MSLVIHKYGGATLADPIRVQAAARRIALARRAGTDVFVVVDAAELRALRAALSGTDVPVLAGAGHPAGVRAGDSWTVAA
jgi:aspartokinase